MSTKRSGFTLVELLVVIAIFLMVAIVAIPVLGTLNGRQVTDGARIFTGGLVGARDSAIVRNKPSGIRLLPDPVLTLPAPGTSQLAGTTQLCYNRYIPIEPAGDYSQGKVSIGPQYYQGGTQDPTRFPPSYIAPDGLAYPFPFVESPGISQVLMIEESPYVGGYTSPNGQPNSPTTWYWNVRVGDKITIGTTGRKYTVVGPCVVHPLGSGVNRGNPEMFVNVGAPGTDSPLVRSYYPLPSTATPSTLKPFSVMRPEFLFLVNGVDDDEDGYTDEGFDGFNQNPPPAPTWDPTRVVNTFIDELFEWETENWSGSFETIMVHDTPVNTPAGSPSADWIYANFSKTGQDLDYLITRRPVPSPGAREVTLPAGLVIDATTWNSTQERSRIPVSPGSLYCDIMVDPSGLYVPTSQYSSPTSASPLPFLHFWITAREDVHPVGSLKDATGNPITTTASQAYLLPMPADTPGYLSVPGTPVLKADRRLVTMFTQSGLVTTNTIESVPALNAYQPGEGFNVTNVNYPFYKAQQGQREAR